MEKHQAEIRIIHASPEAIAEYERETGRTHVALTPEQEQQSIESVGRMYARYRAAGAKDTAEIEAAIADEEKAALEAHEAAKPEFIE